MVYGVWFMVYDLVHVKGKDKCVEWQHFTLNPKP